MIIAASDEALRDSQISVKTSEHLALDQNPGPKEVMASKGSMGQNVFPDAPAHPFGSGHMASLYDPVADEHSEN